MSCSIWCAAGYFVRSDRNAALSQYVLAMEVVEEAKTRREWGRARDRQDRQMEGTWIIPTRVASRVMAIKEA